MNVWQTQNPKCPMEIRIFSFKFLNLKPVCTSMPQLVSRCPLVTRDSSRCLARALTPHWQVCYTSLLRADVAQLDLAIATHLEDQGPVP